ncbi:MAG: hypothetical protein QXY73_04230 [Candidatus Bathyarchaeia archaeon]|nr:hypothetical protein [Candidatus Bathyarchaeota archaeon]
MRVSRRELLITGLNSEQIDVLIDGLRNFLKEEAPPDGYVINVHKEAIACCGVFPVGVAIEIEGIDEHVIEHLDQKLCAKVIEICEQKGIEHHKCEPIRIT